MDAYGKTVVLASKRDFFFFSVDVRTTLKKDLSQVSGIREKHDPAIDAFAFNTLLIKNSNRI